MVVSRNISDLSSLSAPSTDDVFLIVDRLSPTSTEAKQITWGSIAESIQDLVSLQATSSTTVTFTYDDPAGVLTALVNDNTSTQKSRFSSEGVLIGTRHEIDFRDGAGTNVVLADVTSADRIQATFNNTGVVTAVNNSVSGTSFPLISGTPAQADGTKELQIRPLKVGSAKISAALTDSSGSITLDIVPSQISINDLDTSAPLAISTGGTASSNAAGARANLAAAKSGVNADITSITGLNTPLSVPQGGTGGSNPSAGLANLQGIKVLENLGTSGESLIASGSTLVSGEYRGQLKSLRPSSNKVLVATVGNELTLDVNADNILSSATTTVDLNNQRLINVAAPLSATDCVNKSYADSVAQGLTVKGSCQLATTGLNISADYFRLPETVTSINVASNTLTTSVHPFNTGELVVVTSSDTLPGGVTGGTIYYIIDVNANDVQLAASATDAAGGTPINISSVGAGTITLTHALYLRAPANGALTVDGVAVSVGDRILIKDQTDSTQNGIYNVHQTGGVSERYLLIRADDFNTSSEAASGSFTFVEQGTISESVAYIVTTQNAVLDVSDIFFTTFSSANIPVRSITNNKFVLAAQSTVKGRAQGAGTGEIQDLTDNQIIAIIENATGTLDLGTY